MIDWQIVVIAGIAALPPTLLALATLVTALRTHKAVNSKMTELLEATKRQAAAEATLDEKAAPRARVLHASESAETAAALAVQAVAEAAAKAVTEVAAAAAKVAAIKPARKR